LYHFDYQWVLIYSDQKEENRSMLAREAQQAMKTWLSQAPTPEQQLDRRWLRRYRELSSLDSYWWLTWAGPFTEEEQQQWNRLFVPPVDDATKELVAPLLKQSRERELEAALVEQREPYLHYPAIEIDEVRSYITGLVQLDSEIMREESNTAVRQLYHDTIEEDINYLRSIEATYQGDTERFWVLNRRIRQQPTQDEMAYALTQLRRTIQQGFKRLETAVISQQFTHFLHEQLHLSFDFSVGKDEPPVVRVRTSEEIVPTISAKATRAFYETILRESGYEGWQAVIDNSGSGTRVEAGLRLVVLSEDAYSLMMIRHLLAHELAGHVARSFAGEHSPLGLLGLGTRGNASTEEGLALYHQREAMSRNGYPSLDSAHWLGTIATGLASGVVTPQLTFSSLYTFFELLFLLQRCLSRPWEDTQTARQHIHKLALNRCLRTYRGVPDLEQKGVCYLHDVVYLRGLLLIDRVVAEDASVLDRLAVGKVAYDLLPILQSLEMIPPPQPLQQLAYAPELDSYMLSFEASADSSEKLV
jgi:hypothetical protein